MDRDSAQHRSCRDGAVGRRKRLRSPSQRLCLGRTLRTKTGRVESVNRTDIPCSTHLQHLLSEILLIVTKWTLEEVSAGIVCSLLDAVSVEPTAAAGSPEEVLTLPVLQGHRAAATLLPHLHRNSGLLRLGQRCLQRFVD